jgi:hypothetical protein
MLGAEAAQLAFSGESSRGCRRQFARKLAEVKLTVSRSVRKHNEQEGPHSFANHYSIDRR